MKVELPRSTLPDCPCGAPATRYIPGPDGQPPTAEDRDTDTGAGAALTEMALPVAICRDCLSGLPEMQRGLYVSISLQMAEAFRSANSEPAERVYQKVRLGQSEAGEESQIPFDEDG